MKYFFLFLTFLISQCVYALPCPNGQGVLYKGDSIANVLKQCGEPNQKISRNLATNSWIEWVYYLPHQYDYGGTQISLLVNNGFIARINIYDENFSGICGQTVTVTGGLVNTTYSCGNTNTNAAMANMCGRTVSVGEPIAVVTSSCGPPYSQKVLQGGIVERVEFIYTTQPPQTIVFENGTLVGWK